MYINESLCCIADINTTMQINCRVTKFKEEVVRFSSRALKWRWRPLRAGHRPGVPMAGELAGVGSGRLEQMGEREKSTPMDFI